MDGATSEDGKPSNIGVIIRDSRSETETIAIKKGVLLAKEMGAAANHARDWHAHSGSKLGNKWQGWMPWPSYTRD